MRLGAETGTPDRPFASSCLDAPMLSSRRERKLLNELARLRQRLAESIARLKGRESSQQPEGAAEASRLIADALARWDGTLAGLTSDFERYSAVRNELAMSNMRLVAHVAKRYRDRGIAQSDLLQEGFCGLLEAIDRFDVSHETRLSTYATWWIRQSVQNALASGAYPVRLSPRHLRELARSQEKLGSEAADARVAGRQVSETTRCIQAATRPAVSLSVTNISGRDASDRLSLSVRGGAEEEVEGADLDEHLEKLMNALRPRERQVLSLRFGLGNRPRLSLSQVGQLLDVSKERVRQIQDRALALLRAIVSQDHPLGSF